MNNKDLIYELLNALREDCLTDEQFAQLDQLLQRDESARREYIQFMNLCVDMKDFEQAGIINADLLTSSPEAANPDFSLSPVDSALWKALSLDEKTSPSVCIHKTPKTPEIVSVEKTHTPNMFRLSNAKRSLLIFGASLAALILMIAYVYVDSAGRLPTVATLSRTVDDAQWLNVTGELTENGQLCPGPLHLTKGQAEIITHSGAQIILQAPVELELESDSQLLLKKGRLTVNIASAQASQFVVRTPNACVVDFGTEFGVDVDNQNQTSTHVFQGQVELRSGSNPLRLEGVMKLFKGQAGQAGPQGQLTEAEDILTRFVRPQEFEIRCKAAQGSAYHRWKAYSYQLRRDPAMVAYYTFEKNEQQQDTLFNMAAATEGRMDGQLTSQAGLSSPTWDQGRWPEKTALSFNRNKNQFVDVPGDPGLGINGPITVAAWIYVGDENEGGHILTNRLENAAINYQLGYRSPDSSFWNDRIQFARKESYHAVSDFIHSNRIPLRLGWLLITATHDNQTLKYYLNGQLIDSRSWIYKQDLIESGLMIGTSYHKQDVSRFDGKMGEIAILKRVLSDEEISEMYSAGKP